jgi:hypothetical protein
MQINRSSLVVVAAGVMGLMSVARAQQPANDPNNTAPAPPPPGAVRFAVGGPMGGGNAIILPSGTVMNRDSLSPLVMTLGELNLGPDFTLTAEQKQKIQAIRDDFKAATEAFKKDHAEEIKQLDDQQKEMMDGFQTGNIPDPNAMMELNEQRRALMQGAPDGTEHANQVRAALNPDQLKKVQEKEAAQAKEREEMQARFPMMRMGGQGGVMMQPSAAPSPAPEKEKDKDKDGKGR